MSTGRNPRSRLRIGPLAIGVSALLSFFSPSASELYAQPEHQSLLKSSQERSRLFRDGQYFRAYDATLSDSHSWSSSERLVRSEAAIYAGLRHAASEELATLDFDRVNDQYTAGAALRNGWISLKNGEFGQARLYFNEAVSAGFSGKPTLKPVAGEALFWIGISHLIESGRGGYEQATRALAECVESYPDNPRSDDALYYLGQLAEARTEYASAINRYAELLDRYPESEYRVTSGVRRTQLLVMERKYEQAALQLEETSTLWAWHKAGKTEQTQQHNDQVEYELVLLRGEISVGKKDLPGAERAYLTLLYTLDGAYRRDGMLGLAETYRSAGQYDSARSIYGRIIEERVDDRPGMTAEYFRAALTLGQSDATEEERGTARGVMLMIAGDGNHLMADQARLTLADQAYRDGEFAEAARLSRNAVENADGMRTRARAHAVLGASLMELDRFSEAAVELDSAALIAAHVPEIEMPERADVIELSSRMKGIAHFWAQEYPQAIDALDRYLAVSPDTAQIPHIAWILGESYYEAGRYAEAISTMEQLLDQAPSSEFADDALYTEGWSQLKLKNFTAAQGAFGRLVKAYPLSTYAAESQIRRGDCFYMHKDFGKAAEMYGHVPSLNPTPIELEYASYQKALATWQAGDTISSRREFSLFVTNNGSSAWADDALFMTGLIDYRAGDYPGAISIMRGLLDSYTDSRLHARAYYTIGDSYYRMRKFDDALAAYSIVTERYPESTYMRDAETGIVYARAAQQKVMDQNRLDVLQVSEIEGRPSYEMGLRRAQIFLDANRIDDAEIEYQSFIQENPESSNLAAGYYGLAECSLLRRDTLSAIDTLSFVVANMTEGHVVPMAALRLTDLHLSRRDTISAVETLAILRENFPETAAVTTALIREAELLEDIGEFDDAKSLLRNGVAMLDTVSGYRTNSGAQILGRLARLEFNDGEFEYARSRWAVLAQREDSVGTDAKLNIGLSYLEEGRGEAAIETFEVLMGQGGDRDFLTRCEMGMARGHESIGNLEMAEYLYKGIVKQRGNDSYGQEASRRLKEMTDS